MKVCFHSNKTTLNSFLLSVVTVFSTYGFTVLSLLIQDVQLLLKNRQLLREERRGGGDGCRNTHPHTPPTTPHPPTSMTRSPRTCSSCSLAAMMEKYFSCFTAGIARTIS